MANENIQNEREEQSQDEILSGILQRLSASQSSTGAGSPSVGNGGDIFSSLLSNPELLSKLPTILSAVKPILELFGGGGASGSPQQQTQASTPAVAMQSTPAALQKSSPSADSRTALLCAMKPYLSRDRQNAIDYIVKLGRLGDILKTL